MTRLRRLDVVDEVEALRAAVHHQNVVGKAPAAVKFLHAAHAEPFIGPQDIADAEDQDGARRVYRHLPSSLNMRQPLTMVLIMLCRLMMSSRTAA